MKTCTKCGEEKAIEDFNRRPNYHKSKTLYRKSHCKKCDIGFAIKWREQNIERFRKYQRDYHRKKHARIH